MNREILFRGQHRRKGEKVFMDGTPVESKWIYGGVLQGEGDFSIIYQTEPEFHKYPVYTDTLGQYTGLTDRNGARIFEGDILEAENGNRGHVVFRNGAFMKLCNSEDMPFLIAADVNVVIGNVFDNPELLKGESNV